MDVLARRGQAAHFLRLWLGAGVVVLRLFAQADKSIRLLFQPADVDCTLQVRSLGAVRLPEAGIAEDLLLRTRAARVDGATGDVCGGLRARHALHLWTWHESLRMVYLVAALVRLDLGSAEDAAGIEQTAVLGLPFINLKYEP